MYKAIIVEDDLMVCAILEKQFGRFPQLKLVGSFRRGAEAMNFLADDPDGADLIILDYYMTHGRSGDERDADGDVNPLIPFRTRNFSPFVLKR